jgi:hypothetical protein
MLLQYDKHYPITMAKELAITYSSTLLVPAPVPVPAPLTLPLPTTALLYTAR